MSNYLENVSIYICVDFILMEFYVCVKGEIIYRYIYIKKIGIMKGKGFGDLVLFYCVYKMEYGKDMLIFLLRF